uniref:Putative Defensin 1 n=1 Tax=Megacormus gertschi TaxID=1843536 RepID=A0A224X3K1_9SCOR
MKFVAFVALFAVCLLEDGMAEAEFGCPSDRIQCDNYCKSNGAKEGRCIGITGITCRCYNRK